MTTGGPPEATSAVLSGFAAVVMDALAAGGHEARVVGGAVRDALMGRPIGEIDLATTAEPQDTIRALAAAGLRALPTGIAHGTVTAVGVGGSIEVTTLRRDVETDGRHATVVFGTDWRADAERRDFTVNALSVDRTGRVHDPIGGRADIAARRIRFIGDPHRRIAEDRLRAWRYLRFFAEIETGAPDGAALAAVAAARADIGRLSAERVARELRRLLLAPRAVDAVALAAGTGLLVDVVGVPRPGVLARVIALGEDDAAHRLAALCAHLDEDAHRIATRLRLSNAERESMAVLAASAPQVARRPRRVLAETGPLYPAACRLAWALSADPPDDPAWRARLTLPERDPVPAFPLRGADLIARGFAPGPEVGRTLDRLHAIWMQGDYRAGRLELLARLGDPGDRCDRGDLGRER